METEYKKDTECQQCGFIPVYLCQLDVDHIDGDHYNNDPKNLQTLCANCHRAKTYEQLEWNRYLRERERSRKTVQEIIREIRSSQGDLLEKGTGTSDKSSTFDTI